MERTIPSVTMSLRSSGSMTWRRESRIWLSEGMSFDCRRRESRSRRPTKADDAPGGVVD